MLIIALESAAPYFSSPQNEAQKVCVGKFCAHSLTHDERVHRGNDKQALIIRAERNYHVRWRRPANTDATPSRALPFEIEFLFVVDLAGVGRLPIQPEGQSVGR